MPRKGAKSSAKRRSKPKTLSAKDGIEALRKPARIRAIEALNLIRSGSSIGKAAREMRTTPATVKRYVGNALRKKGARIVATRSDRIPAVMRVPTTAGAQMLIVVGSRSRNLLGQYWTAVRRFGETGAVRYLQPFGGKTINVEGGEIPLLTDPRVLTRLLKEGRMSMESIYGKGGV